MRREGEGGQGAKVIKGKGGEGVGDSDRWDASLKRVNFGDLTTVKTLGRGTFGTVRLVEHRGDGAVYALKELQKSTVIAMKQQRNVVNEVQLLAVEDRRLHMYVPYYEVAENLELYQNLELVEDLELLEELELIESLPEERG